MLVKKPVKVPIVHCKYDVDRSQINGTILAELKINFTREAYINNWRQLSCRVNGRLQFAKSLTC
jgi:hypothetical protein